MAVGAARRRSAGLAQQREQLAELRLHRGQAGAGEWRTGLGNRGAHAIERRFDSFELRGEHGQRALQMEHLGLKVIERDQELGLRKLLRVALEAPQRRNHHEAARDGEERRRRNRDPENRVGAYAADSLDPPDDGAGPSLFDSLFDSLLVSADLRESVM